MAAIEEVEAPQASLPRCVFAPSGTGPRTLFGLNADGSLIHVDDVPSGIGDLLCPDCASSLVAKKGKVRRPHFAHHSTAECTSAGETALHRLAKDIVAGGGLFYLPAATVSGLKGIEYVRPATDLVFDDVEVEVWENGFRPDLIGIKRVTKDGRVLQRRLIIEIMVTHAVDDRKLQELKRRGESVLQIDLSEVDRSLGYDDLALLVLQTAPREWLFHRDVDRRAKEIEQERLREEERQAEIRRRSQERLERERQRREEQSRRAEAKRKEEQDRQERLRLELHAEARATPPKPTPPDLREWAETEWSRWRLAGLSRFQDLRGDDGIFDVEPHAWKAVVLREIAPWRDKTLDIELPNQTVGITIQAAAALERRGLVKPAFLHDRPASRWLRASHPVEQAINDYLRAVFVSYHPSNAISKDELAHRLPHILDGMSKAFFGSNVSARGVYGLVVRCLRKGALIELAGRRVMQEQSEEELLEAAADYTRARRDASLPLLTFLPALHVGQRLEADLMTESDRELLQKHGIRISIDRPVLG